MQQNLCLAKGKSLGMRGGLKVVFNPHHHTQTAVKVERLTILVQSELTNTAVSRRPWVMCPSLRFLPQW